MAIDQGTTGSRVLIVNRAGRIVANAYEEFAQIYPRPGWVEHVNGPQTEAELAALRRCVQRGSPFGEGAWCDQIVRRLGLESTLRPQGRPKKRENGS